MPGEFDKLWNTWAEPVHQAQFGFPIVYSDRDGNNKQQIDSALVTRERQERRYNQYGGYDIVTTRTARFSTDRRAFSIDGMVEIEGKLYAFESAPVIEGMRTQFNLKRVEVGELTKSGYRRE